MATINKNLDSIVYQAINGPKVDGIPMYSRLDGNQEESFNKSINKSVKWEKASKTTYTSPTNIKRVFISSTKIVIQTYKPAIIKGVADSKGTWREVSLAGDNNISEIIIKALNYNQDLSKYYMEKQINKEAKEPDKVILKGTGLGAISNPWVLSNIEEIYFDWTLLATENNRNLGIGCNELLEQYIKGKRGYISGEVALNMFLRANSANIKDIRNRFPRLRVVGLISELSKILDAKHDKGRVDLSNLEESIKLWVESETNIELIKQSKSMIMINKLDKDIPKYNTKFSLRDGIYKFDRDILKNYFESYEEKVKEFTRIKKDTTIEKSSIEIKDTRTEKSELEVLLDNLVRERCLADAKSVLLLSFAGSTVNEIEEVFMEMSTEGEKKYKALIK